MKQNGWTIIESESDFPDVNKNWWFTVELDEDGRFSMYWAGKFFYDQGIVRLFPKTIIAYKPAMDENDKPFPFSGESKYLEKFRGIKDAKEKQERKKKNGNIT